MTTGPRHGTLPHGSSDRSTPHPTPHGSERRNETTKKFRFKRPHVRFIRIDWWSRGTSVWLVVDPIMSRSHRILAELLADAAQRLGKDEAGSGTFFVGAPEMKSHLAMKRSGLQGMIPPLSVGEGPFAPYSGAIQGLHGMDDMTWSSMQEHRRDECRMPRD